MDARRNLGGKGKNICPSRPGKLPHKWTSMKSINGGPYILNCCWCGKVHPKKKNGTPKWTKN